MELSLLILVGLFLGYKIATIIQVQSKVRHENREWTKLAREIGSQNTQRKVMMMNVNHEERKNKTMQGV